LSAWSAFFSTTCKIYTDDADKWESNEAVFQYIADTRSFCCCLYLKIPALLVSHPDFMFLPLFIPQFGYHWIYIWTLPWCLYYEDIAKTLPCATGQYENYNNKGNCGPG